MGNGWKEKEWADVANQSNKEALKSKARGPNQEYKTRWETKAYKSENIRNIHNSDLYPKTQLIEEEQLWKSNTKWRRIWVTGEKSLFYLTKVKMTIHRGRQWWTVDKWNEQLKGTHFFYIV